MVQPGFRRLIVLPCAIALTAVLICPIGADEVKQEMTAAVAAVRPALIRIHVVSAEYQQGREIKIESSGSGVIISGDGYAVTNHHVAADAERLVCTLADKRQAEAKLVGTDPLADIAVIKIKSPDGKPLPYASFGDSSKLSVGDRVYAMGSPFAISQSVTMGIISNTEMILPEMFVSRGLMLEGEDVGSIVRWIGHDALIEPGNSGGPLVDGSGTVVGINEINIGLAGAIPSNLAKDVAEQIIQHGSVIRSWFGVEVQPLLRSSSVTEGILVSGVIADSPAAKAGLRSSDIIQKVNDIPVTARFREQVPLFNQLVASLPVGKPARLTVLRDGRPLALTVVTAERQKAMDKEHELRDWGMVVSNITSLMQKEWKLESQDGIMVTGVLPSGAAGSARPTLREGDVITRVRSEPVKDVAGLRALTRQLTEDNAEPEPAVVTFVRDSRNYLTVVRVGRQEQSQPGSELSKAWLPIDLQSLTRELAAALAMPDATGVRVTKVHSRPGTEPIDLRVGDVIVKLDGEPIPAEQEGDEEVLPSLLRQYDIGSEVTLGIVRDGRSVDIKAKLQASPRPPRDFPKYEDEEFEFTARDIAFADVASAKVDRNEKGVLVESVTEGGWAALGGLKAGDVIGSVNGRAVGSVQELRQVLTQITQERPEAVVLTVSRGIHSLFVEIRPEWGD